MGEEPGLEPRRAVTKFYAGVAAGWLMALLLPTPILNTITNRRSPQ